MSVTKILDGVTSVLEGPVFQFKEDGVHNETCQVQVEITGTATVLVMGRLDPTAPWVPILAFTESGIQQVATCPEMYAFVAVYTDGAVNVWVGSVEMA